jgi:hypothetical protein
MNHVMPGYRHANHHRVVEIGLEVHEQFQQAFPHITRQVSGGALEKCFALHPHAPNPGKAAARPSSASIARIH